VAPSTGCGDWKRDQASTPMPNTTASIASAFTSAASSSTRPRPKLWRAEGGRAAIHDASSAKPSAAPSVTMWPASANSASEPPRQPATASTSAYAQVSVSASSRRWRCSGAPVAA
jgi:hypothetical protein